MTRRSQPVRRGLFLLIGLLAVAPIVRGQQVPYTAVVVEDQVEVKSGAGPVFYATGTLSRGDVVVVEEIFHGWNKIKPPAGVYSYISKAFVNRQGDGAKGVVNRDQSAVKAANLKGPALSYRGQCELNKGDEVTIVAEEGSYYKIEPPDGVFVFLHPGAVKRATEVGGATEPMTPVQPAGEEPAPVQPDPVDAQPDQTTEPVEPVEPIAPIQPAPPQPTPDPAEPSDPVQPDQPVDLGKSGDVEAAEVKAELGGLARLDARMLPLFEKPVQEQPIEQMIDAYSKFLDDPELSPVDQRVVRLRLAALEHNRKVVAALRQTDQTLADIQAARDQQERIDANTFDAVGILRASSVYDGQNMPLMYRLVDSTTRRTKVYLTPSPALRPNEMLGRLVGVAGRASFDEALKLSVIDPVRATVLEAGQ